jgi:hypothetical protein
MKSCPSLSRGGAERQWPPETPAGPGEAQFRAAGPGSGLIGVGSGGRYRFGDRDLKLKCGVVANVSPPGTQRWRSLGLGVTEGGLGSN